jgi:hypothetical protein
MPNFKVPCPSCEAPVLIKDVKLVGSKVECPKCKYRFKVEEPKTPVGGETKPEEAKKDNRVAKSDDKKKAQAAGKNKKLVPILAGVGAVVLLIGVGFAMFGGGNANKKTGGGPSGFTGPVNTGGNNSNGDGTEDGTDPDKKPKDKGEPPPPPIPRSTKVTANLLPGQAVAVYRFNMDKVRENPIYPTLAEDTLIREMVRQSLGFSLSEIDTYIHCFVGADRAPFGLIKLKNPNVEPAMISRISRQLESTPKPVNGRNLYKVRYSSLIKAVSQSLSFPSLFGEFYTTVPDATPDGGKERVMGMCVYDTQHLIIADYALLDRFLGELDADGYPPFQTVWIENTPAPAPKAKEPTDANAIGAEPQEPKKTAPPQPAPPADGRPYSTRNAYRTIEPALKRALDEMEPSYVKPMFVYAEKFAYGEYEPARMKKDYELLAGILDPIAQRTRYLGVNVLSFTPREIVANLRLTFDGIDDSRTLAKEQLSPALQKLSELLTLYLKIPIQFRDYTSGGTTTLPNPGLPDMGMGPGFPGPGYPGPGGPGTGSPSPGIGSPSPGLPPGSGGPGIGSPSGPPTLPPGSPFPQPKGGSGIGTLPPDDETDDGDRGPRSGFPTFPRNPNQPFDPNRPFDPNQPIDPDNPVLPPSHLDLGMIDNQLLIGVELFWTDTIYRVEIAPRVVSVINQVKGKMAIFSAEFSWEALAQAGPRAATEPNPDKEKMMFPRGTAKRVTGIDRYGLEHLPVTRVSFFHELLPYMGRGELARRIDPRHAWFAQEFEKPDPMAPHKPPVVKVDNLTPATEWVPELLVPYYPQSAWRASMPDYAPNHTLGATNYVAVAGVGLNIARKDPHSPEYKTKVGMTGYAWGSRVEEVSDGLSNTIYLLQTPPGLQQPWIAGGGATVRGLDERDPMAAFKYRHPDGTGGWREGTYALMGDGSVRWIPANIDPKVLHALATRAGGEKIADIDAVAPKVEPPKPKEEPKPEPAPGTEVAPAPREKKE